MTDKTEDAAAKAAAEKLAKTGMGFLITIALYALFAWVGGVALNVGFGVSVPFVAAWLLLIAGASVIKAITQEVATSWHNIRVKADINLLVASMAAQEHIHNHVSADGLTGLLDSLKATEGADRGNGGYL